MTSKDLPIDTEQGASEKPQSGNKLLSKQVANLRPELISLLTEVARENNRLGFDREYRETVGFVTEHIVNILEDFITSRLLVAESFGRADELVKLSAWGKTIDDQWNEHFKKRLATLKADTAVTDLVATDGEVK